MPVRVDAATAMQRWQQGMANAGPAMQRGVAALQTSPGASAAAAADKWLMKVSQSKDKFARRVGSVTLQQWQQAMNSYGISRASQGAQQKGQKMQSFMAEYLPYLKQGVDQVQGMPKNTLEDGIARAVAMIQHNAKFQRGSGMS